MNTTTEFKRPFFSSKAKAEQCRTALIKNGFFCTSANQMPALNEARPWTLNYYRITLFYVTVEYRNGATTIPIWAANKFTAIEKATAQYKKGIKQYEYGKEFINAYVSEK